MSFLRPQSGSPIKLRLARDLVRSLKRGHPWVYADALRQLPAAAAGSHALLLDNRKGREVARGFYDPNSPLAFRACTVEQGERLDDRWAVQRLKRALLLRQMLFGDRSEEEAATTGFRLCNGEGDGLPGLICDLYGDTAVVQLDGAGPAGFWQVEGIAEWIAESLSLRRVYLRPQARSSSGGRALVGDMPANPAPFVEHGVRFTADVRQGQKTGFFLDQRENRRRIKPLAANRRALNLFGYTGGFSVYAGLGGAERVTTVDLARPAIDMASYHWQLNDLPAASHEPVVDDVFDFLNRARQQKRVWDLVISDPPSFASSKEAVKQAIVAYRKLIAAAAGVTAPDGLLAAASCSSHIELRDFLSACEEGVSLARRRAALLGVHGQPADHPTPLPFPEFRYLKFVLMRVE